MNLNITNSSSNITHVKLDPVGGNENTVIPDPFNKDEYILENNLITNIITLSLVAITLFIYIPLCIYFVYPLFARRRDIIFQKRYIKLSLISVICIVIEIIASALQTLFVFKVVHEGKFNKHTLILANNIIICFNLFAGNCFMTVMYVRFWLIYYDTNYNVLMANDKWRSIIDNNYDTNDNFFIKNKAKWGNQQFLMRFIAVDTILNAIITPIIVELGFGNYLMILMLLFYIAFFTIYLKLRKLVFYDEFHILEEFRLLGVTLSIIVLIWGLLGITTYILTEITANRLYNTIYITVFLYMYFQAVMIYNIWSIYVMTRWVIKKIENDPSIQQQYLHFAARSSSSGTNTSTITRILMTTSIKRTSIKKTSKALDAGSKPIKINEILSNNEYFTSFMKHLGKEFSMELLLSLVEFIQFKQEIIYKQLSDKDDSNNNDKNEDDKLTKIKLAKCIPKSTIVYDKNDDLETKALKLYKKYIQIGSEWEININSDVRKQLRYQFEGNSNESKWNMDNLYCIFDSCCDEMVKLLGYSLSRFKQKPQYIRLQSLKK